MRHQITIEHGCTFTVDPEEDSLLRGALRAGVGLPYECSVGGCGSCRFELIDGEMETLWEAAPGLSARERARGKRLACQSRPLGNCTIRARVEEAGMPAQRTAKHRVTLRARRTLTDDMAEFTFAGVAPADFLPGQYALLYPPGVIGPRAYSMSNLSNADGVWQFIIRRAGSGSAAMFDTLKIGDGLTLDGPYGHAWLREGTSRDMVCIAGGSGLGPMLSIARGALATGTRRIHFFVGLRTQSDLGAAGEALALQGDDRLDVQVALSAPDAAQAWSGRRGFVHDAVEETMGGSLPNLEVYFAGPPPMVEALQSMLLVRHKVPVHQIHYDRFV